MKQKLTIFITIVILSLVSSMVSAGEQVLEEPISGAQITFSAPDTYPACPTTATSDHITTSGVPSDWRLVGNVTVMAQTEDGFENITTYPINQNGDLDLTVEYPPVSNWPVFTLAATGQRHAQLQVDLSMELVTAENVFIGALNILSGPGAGQVVPSIGPYNDWGVFCDNPPESSTLFDRLPRWLQRLIIWLLRILFHFFFG
jgi:hypothetical protein